MNVFDFRVGHEFEDGGFGAFFGVEDVGEATSAEFAGGFGEIVDFATGEAGATFDAKGFDTRGFEDFEVGVFEDFGEVDKFHAVTEIGFVGAVGVHGEVIRQARDEFVSVETRFVIRFRNGEEELLGGFGV